MASPAAEARSKVKDLHPEAIVVERGRHSIKHRLADTPEGRQRFALDVSVGPFHYGPDSDQEIDTALVSSTAPWDWEMTKAGFEVRALADLSAGQVIEYRSGPEWVRFQPHALQYSNDLNQIQAISMPQAVDASVEDDTLTWTDGYGAGRSLSWQAQTARLAKLLTINALTDLPTVEQFILDGGNPVLELNLIFAHSSGVTPYVNGQEWGKGQNVGDRNTQGLVEFRDDQGNILWWFNLPRSWDAEGNEQLGTFRFKKQGNSLFVTHRVPLAFVQGAVYPLMVDTTVDEQVGASLDDAFEGGVCSNVTSSNRCGTFFGTSQVSGMRFATVDINPGSDIDLAFIELFGRASSGSTWLTKVLGHDVDDAPNYSICDVKARISGAGTAAQMDWDPASWAVGVWHQSPEIKSVIQEIVDRGGWAANQAMGILWNDDGTAGSDSIDGDSYDASTTQAPKLHVEFTPAGEGDEFGAVAGEAMGAMHIRPARVVPY